MKRSVRIICLLLVLSMVMVFPAYASENASTWGSAFFSAYGTGLYKTSSTSFQIWFDVDSNASMMDKIGVSEITVYRSSDQTNWIKIKTYKPSNYPEMLDENTSSHTGYVTYDIASPGYYYTALVTFYAKNSTGVGERDVYTSILQM